MAIRDAFKDNSFSITGDDGEFVEEVDLTIMPWNRSTVADGQWLNDRAIAPLSARDVYLADCIDNVINDLGAVQDTVRGLANASGEGRRAIALNDVGGVAGDSIKHSQIIASAGNYFMPPSSFAYWQAAHSIWTSTDKPPFTNMDGAVLQCNAANSSAMQMIITTGGNIAVRSLTSLISPKEESTTVTGETGNESYVYVDNTQSDWSVVPVFLGNKTASDDLYGLKFNGNGNYTWTKIENGGGGGGGGGGSDYVAWSQIGSGLAKDAYNGQLTISIADNGNLAIDTGTGAISAKDTTYTDGNGITLTNTTFAVDVLTASGLLLAGDTEGSKQLAVNVDNNTIKFNTDGKLYCDVQGGTSYGPVENGGLKYGDDATTGFMLDITKPSTDTQYVAKCQASDGAITWVAADYMASCPTGTTGNFVANVATDGTVSWTAMPEESFTALNIAATNSYLTGDGKNTALSVDTTSIFTAANFTTEYVVTDGDTTTTYKLRDGSTETTSVSAACVALLKLVNELSGKVTALENA